jgi:hypothetical protein
MLVVTAHVTTTRTVAAAAELKKHLHSVSARLPDTHASRSITRYRQVQRCQAKCKLIFESWMRSFVSPGHICAKPYAMGRYV